MKNGSKESFDLSSSTSDLIQNEKRYISRLSIFKVFVLLLLGLILVFSVTTLIVFAKNMENFKPECQCQYGQQTNNGKPVSAGPPTKPSTETSSAASCKPCVTDTEHSIYSVTLYHTGTSGLFLPIVAERQASYRKTTNIYSLRYDPALPQDQSCVYFFPDVFTLTESFDIRLPTSLKPIHYNLRLRPEIYGPDQEKFTISGDVAIIIECVSETSNITLHMEEMELTSDPVVTSDTASPTYWKHTKDIAREFLIIHLTGTLNAGQRCTLRLQFKAKITKYRRGFFRDFYTNGNKTVNLAFSVFEPIDARTAFPCFDEPAMKATFNISLDRKTDSHIMTLSNMPLIRSLQLNDGYTRDIFQKSVPMSTYLVAFSFTDYIGRFNYTLSGTKVGVYSRPDSTNTELALRVNVEILEAFESYFDIPYSLPKLDSIGISHFYEAVENWGLVTYADRDLQYVPGFSMTDTYDSLHIVIAHELAHQWCGNLVSPAWWDDLWLNEGFASYLSFLALDMIRPSWKMTEYHAVKWRQNVMDKDGLDTSQPIRYDVLRQYEIWMMFDVMTYQKASYVIRMMRFFLGEDTFRYGMQEYLRSKKYSSANHNDLYKSLEKRARRDGLNINLESIMDTWIEQKNYPVVNVTFDSNSGKITLRQQRFLFSCIENKAQCENSSFAWEIPFTYTTSEQPDFQQTFQNIKWMSKSKRSKEITGKNLPSSSDGWILGNIQMYGFYIVTYSQDNWDALQRQLMKDHTVIHVLNRAQLIDDTWTLFKAGMLDVATTLSMMNYLKNETEYLPWLAAQNNLAEVEKYLEKTAIYGKFQAYVVNIIKNRFDAIDITKIEHKNIQDRHFAGMIFDLACKHFIQSCEDQALQIFNDWRINGKQMPPDVKATIMCTAVREGGETEWNFVYEAYQTSRNEKNTALRALGCTSKHWLQKRLLDYSMMEEKIDEEDFIIAISELANNPDGFHQALNFVLTNWNDIVARFKLSYYRLSTIISTIAKSMTTDNDIQQIKYWRNVIHPKHEGEPHGFDSAIERIKNAQRWLKKNLQGIDDWLNPKK